MRNDSTKDNSSRPQELVSPSVPPQRMVDAVYQGGQLTPLEPLNLPDGIPVVLQLAVHVSNTPIQKGDQSWELVPHLEVETVEAIYEDGAIRFLSPVNLPENTPIRLSMIWRLAMLATLRIDSLSSVAQTVSVPELLASSLPSHGHSTDTTAVVQQAHAQSGSTLAINFASAQHGNRLNDAPNRIRAARIGVPRVNWAGLRSRFARPLSRNGAEIAVRSSVFGRHATSGDFSGDIAAQPHIASPRPRARLLAGLSVAQLRWLSIAGIVLAVVLSYGGQVVLSRTTGDNPREGMMQALAGGLLIAGALLYGALAGHAAAHLPRLEFPRMRVSQPVFVWHNRWSLGWLAAAIVLATGAVGIFTTFGETPAVVLSWLVSIVALFAAQLWGARIARPRLVAEERPYLVAMAVLLVVALIARVYKLTTLPYNVDGDFAAVGLQARALATGQQQHIFTYGWAAVPILGYLPPWLTMKLFGDGLAGLNASGVVEGLLIILGVYVLGRDLFHARVGLIAAALLAASYTHLAASRQSSYIDPVVFLVYAIYFLLVGLREGRGWAIVTSGLLTALCVQMYYSGRIVVFIVGFILLFLLLFRRPWLRARWWAVPLWVLAVLITLGPMLVVFIRDHDGFITRTRQVFILNSDIIKHEQSVYQVETLAGLLLQQARRAALMFHYYVDTGTQFGLRRPFLDPFTAPLFSLGIGYALFRWRRIGDALVLAWAVLGVLVGCFLTANAPFWARLMILLPPTALLASLALNRLYELANRGLKRVGGRTALIAPAALVLLLLGVGLLNWNTYVTMKGTFATPRTRIGRYLADQPASTRAYLVSSDLTYHDREFEFLAPGRLAANLTPEQVKGDITPLGAPTLLILTPEQRALLQQLQRRFPGVSAETHIGNTPDEVAFYVVRLP